MTIGIRARKLPFWTARSVSHTSSALLRRSRQEEEENIFLLALPPSEMPGSEQVKRDTRKARHPNGSLGDLGMKSEEAPSPHAAFSAPPPPVPA
ncbi:unnamed protein product [Lota lota]